VPNPRTYTDEQLRTAVASSTNWTQVMRALGKSPGNSNKGVVAVALRLGLDTSHFAYKQSFQRVASVPMPFSNRVRPGGQSGLSIATKWFSDRGYVVSVPLESAPYDLITESDDGLKRVQVKTTTRRESNGRYTARVCHQLHSASYSRNANGNRRSVAYKPEEIDMFFIATPQSMFLIPIEVTEDRITLVLDEKYAAFKIESS
jgi:PD-(D/E)XK endonuclease